MFVPKKKKNQRIVTVTHVIESPIQMQSIKENFGISNTAERTECKIFPGQKQPGFLHSRISGPLL